MLYPDTMKKAGQPLFGRLGSPYSMDRFSRLSVSFGAWTVDASRKPGWGRRNRQYPMAWTLKPFNQVTQREVTKYCLGGFAGVRPCCPTAPPTIS